MRFLKLFKRTADPTPAPPALDERLLVDLAGRADSLRVRGDLAAAKPLYERMLGFDPGNLYALLRLSAIHEHAGELEQARELAERGLSIDPNQIGLLMQLGAVHIARNDPLSALLCYERVRQIDPEVPDLDALLADQYCILGRIADGVAAFDRVLAGQPSSATKQSSRLFVLNYADLMTPEQLADEHRRWATPHEDALASERVPVLAAAHPRLRIGYISPDFREHAVGYFMEPLLREHDRSQFDICCFNILADDEDQVTARMRGHASEWHHLRHADAAALARAIRDSRIDIAVDLTGHTAKNRILAFARKPAPVQVSWLGYLATTGLEAMDYRITDRYLDPVGMTEKLHTEYLWRLPNHACFDPGGDTPDPGPLPALASGHVTFASLNQWSKVTTAMLETWSSLLGRTPGSRLLVIARGAEHVRHADWVREQFAQRGGDPHRIDVVPPRPNRDFLQMLTHVDIALDTYPYGGGTTTLHSLWMGLPVVTLAGRTPMSRNAVGPLTEVGLAHLVADTRERYVEAAASLAGDLPALAGLRGGLRGRMRDSPLLDARRFAGHLEDAYRSMWEKRASRS